MMKLKTIDLTDREHEINREFLEKHSVADEVVLHEASGLVSHVIYRNPVSELEVRQRLGWLSEAARQIAAEEDICNGCGFRH